MAFGDGLGFPAARSEMEENFQVHEELPESEAEEQEVDFSPEQTVEADKALELSRKALALEIAQNLGHLSKSQDEFFEFVERIDSYLR